MIYQVHFYQNLLNLTCDYEYPLSMGESRLNFNIKIRITADIRIFVNLKTLIFTNIHETEKSTRQRTRGIRVEGKPSTNSSRRRKNWSSTRRRRRSNHKACSWRNRDSLRNKTKSIYNQTTLPQPRPPQTTSTKIILNLHWNKHIKSNTDSQFCLVECLIF